MCDREEQWDRRKSLIINQEQKHFDEFLPKWLRTLQPDPPGQ